MAIFCHSRELNLKIMDIRDPGLLEFDRLIDTEEIATDFARENGLLLANHQLNNNRLVAGMCALGTQGCNWTVHEATKRPGNRNTTYQGFRCTHCGRFRSAKNAMIGGEIRGARASHWIFAKNWYL